MRVKERILTIRLMEKLSERPVWANEFGLAPVSKFVISNQREIKY